MADPVVTSKADIRTRFLKQVQALQSGAKNLGEAITTPGQPRQFPVDKNGWDGNVLDPAGWKKPFDRKEHNQDVTKAVSDPEKPGVVGDLAVSTVQGDFLAALERSQRLLHATPVRLTIQAAARKYGHGHAAGLFERGIQAYVTGFLKLSKRTA